MRPVLPLLSALLLLAACKPASPLAPGSSAHGRALELVTLFVGGEKSEFLDNPKTQRLLAEKYGLRLDAVKAGSVEMVRSLDTTGKDALWPSTDLSVEFFRMAGGKSVQTDILFNSPIVVYTGWNIAGALVKAGYVEERGDTYYIVRFPELLADIRAGRSWKDLRRARSGIRPTGRPGASTNG